MKNIFLTLLILFINVLNMLSFEFVQLWQNDNIRIDKVIVYKDPLVFKKNVLQDEKDASQIEWLNAYNANSCPPCMEEFDINMKYTSREVLAAENFTKEKNMEFKNNWQREMDTLPIFFIYTLAEYDVTFLKENKKIKFSVFFFSSEEFDKPYTNVYLSDEMVAHKYEIFYDYECYIYEDDLWKYYVGKVSFQLLNHGTSEITPSYNDEILDHVSEYYLSTKDASGNRKLELIKK